MNSEESSLTWLRFHLPSVAVVSVIALLSGCSIPSDSEEPASIKPATQRQQAPEFSLKDVNGRTVKLSEYRGDVVLLNFWATWCGPCKIEIPWFVEFEKKHKDRGFAVLGISMDDDGWDSVKPFLNRAKVNYRILMGTDTVAMLYGGVQSLPTTFLIDRDGKVAGIHIGLVGKSEYESNIVELLGTDSSAGRNSAVSVLPVAARDGG